MSMHLVGPWMTTTKYNHKSKKNQSQRQLKAEAEHDKWLRKKGVHPDQLAAKKRKDVSINSIPDYKSDVKTANLSNNVGNGFKRHENTYTGDEIAGIATMHKSNLVPVRKDSNDAKDIARMRR